MLFGETYSAVGRGVRGEVNESTLQLLSLSITTHRNHGVPQLLDVLGNEVGQASVDVSWGDGVDTGKIPPLVGERAGQVDATSLCDVVGGLLLREVGNVAGHGGSYDKRTGLALAEVKTNSTCAVKGTGQISLNDFVPLLNGSVEDTVVSGLASIGNENINLAEVLDDVLDELLALGVDADLALVGLDLDAVLLAQFLSILLGTFGVRVVSDGEVSAELSTTTSSLDTDTGRAGSTGDNDDLALKAEKVLELVGLGNWNHDDWCWVSKRGIRLKKVQLSSVEDGEDDGYSGGREGFKYSLSSEKLRPKLPRLVRGLVQSDVWLYAQRHKAAVIRQLCLNVGLLRP